MISFNLRMLRATMGSYSCERGSDQPATSFNLLTVCVSFSPASFRRTQNLGPHKRSCLTWLAKPRLANGLPFPPEITGGWSCLLFHPVPPCSTDPPGCCSLWSPNPWVSSWIGCLEGKSAPSTAVRCGEPRDRRDGREEESTAFCSNKKLELLSVRNF